MARIVVDPLTRIEGHLRIEAELEGGRITNAWSSGTMFRGIETILRGRDPRSAWLMTQRICGVCTTVHALASVRAVENALGISIPTNARLIRNLISAAQLIQDHVIHFYHLTALDWIDPAAALEADPEATASLAQSISEWPKSTTAYFSEVKARVQALVDSGQMSLFTNGYFGHPAYSVPPEVNLLAVAHYLEALEFQRNFIKVHALLGSKNPHLQTYLVGGMATAINLSDDNTINAHTLAWLRELFVDAQTFVNQVYLPDVLAIASFYPEWFEIGAGTGNYVEYGEYPLHDVLAVQTTPDLFFPSGVIFDNDVSNVLPLDHGQIAEHVAHSWYQDYDSGDARHPWEGETDPNYTGPNPPYDLLNVEEKYSWVKAPRYNGRSSEGGPLSRMLVAYARGHERVQFWVNAALDNLGLGVGALNSTMGRNAARCVETVVMAEKVLDWMDELVNNIGRGDTRVHNGELWNPESWPAEAEGWGPHGVPRGSLGHWVRIENGKIAGYQVIAASTWNSCPRDANGNPGPYEAALINNPIADPDRPLEILRTIHAFDPCMACAVHMIHPDGRKIITVRDR
jgi:Ni,Fe-hydrogenase I large subunit